MNIQATRQEIAAALDTVSEIKGYVRRPSTINVGDAWPLWRGGEHADGGAYVQTFAVMVALPGDEAGADEFADAHVPPLLDALAPAMFVESIVPAVLATDQGETLGLMITGRTE